MSDAWWEKYRKVCAAHERDERERSQESASTLLEAARDLQRFARSQAAEADSLVALCERSPRLEGVPS